MKINIYYGGRGLIEDPTLYTLSKITDVLNELRVDVKRYNLYENRNEITALSGTVKEADGIILAASVEWFGMGGFLSQFLDGCWLYGDKSKISKIYMMPVVLSTTYGERDVEVQLERAWELLGGGICPGVTAYVESQTDFETNTEYAKIIENSAENFYRVINQHRKSLPTSNVSLKQNAGRTVHMNLTPEESEQLSKYVSDDNFVKKQKEDIEELSQMFKEMMDSSDETDTQEFIKNFKENFVVPDESVKALMMIEMTDTGRVLTLDIQYGRLKVYYGECKDPNVKATTTREVINRLVNGMTTFQGAFMSGAISIKGDFRTFRIFDQLFRFKTLL